MFLLPPQFSRLNFPMRRAFYVLILFLVFNLKGINSSYAFNDTITNSLLDGFGKYFLDYYQSLNKGEFAAPEKVLADLKGIVKNNLPERSLTQEFEEIDNLFQLTQWLNRRLEPDSLGVNIFIAPESGIINCWLGELKEDRVSFKKIYTQEYHYKLWVIDKLRIHDYRYFLTQGKDEFDFLSVRNIIFCNKEALDKKAKQRWEFLQSRYGSGGVHNYNPSRSDKLRRRLLSLAWGDLFLKIVRENPLGEQEEIFLKQAEEQLLEIGIFHEVGHMLADEQTRFPEDEKTKEAIALLTELGFGPLPYESLNTVLSFAWKSPWKTYRYAGQYILRDFVKETENKYFTDSFRYKFKGINNNSLLRIQNSLYYLSRQQIRRLAISELDSILTKGNI
jgi:hypothetical protein